MSAHRQHAFDIPADPQPVESVTTRMPNSRRCVVALFACLTTIALIALQLALDDEAEVPRAMRVPPPQIVSAPIPSFDDEQRVMLERLRLWRAGYEAAVQNGCQLKPLLASPIASGR